MGWVADLLKEIPSAARYKAELEEMKVENAKLKQKVLSLESEKENLRQEIQRRDEVVQKEKSHKNLLDKEKTDMLLFLHINAGDTHTFQITQSLNISEDIVKYHLQELRKEQFINEGLPYLKGQQSWNITDKGKKYLIENKIIT